MEQKLCDLLNMLHVGFEINLKSLLLVRLIVNLINLEIIIIIFLLT